MFFKYLVVLIIWCFAEISTSNIKNTITGILTECFTPELECPNVNITYWLYTRSNQEKPHALHQNDKNSIASAPWVKDAPIKILLHGYTGHKDYSPNTQLRPAYLAAHDYNVISVDYSPLVKDPCYIQAVKNVKLFGMCTAALIDALVDGGMALEKIHVIGFSMGAHVAGHVGRYVKSGKLPRITGLDPAFPLFVTIDKTQKLDPSDATFVDVVHTAMGFKGHMEDSGHIDFYANGGFNQPGCKSTETKSKASCNHNRSPVYFAESINSTAGFIGFKCSNWLWFSLGFCKNKSKTALFGENVVYGSTGTYFFKTNSEAPFARG